MTEEGLELLSEESSCLIVALDAAREEYKTAKKL